MQTHAKSPDYTRGINGSVTAHHALGDHIWSRHDYINWTSIRLLGVQTRKGFSEEVFSLVTTSPKECRNCMPCMCRCSDDSGVTLILDSAFLPKILPINFVSQSTDLAAISGGEPAECSLLRSVLNVWYYLDQMTATQSSWSTVHPSWRKDTGTFHV